MSKESRRILVISLTDRSARFVEASRTGAQVRIARRSMLSLANGASLDQPVELGKAIQGHLRQQGYTCRTAVVGLSSRWVMARHHTTPPVNDEALHGIARLQAERDASGLADQLSYDYQEVSGNHASREILLIAAQNKRIEQVRRAMEAAGLSLTRIVPTALACEIQDPPSMTLLMQHGGVSVMESGKGGWVALSSYTVRTERLDESDSQHELVAATARHLLSMPPSAYQSGQPIRLLDAIGLNEPARASIAQRLSAQIGPCTVVAADDAEVIATAALTHPDRLVNLIASRLAAKPKRRLPKAAVWGGGAVAGMVLVALVICLAWFWKTHQLHTMQAEYDAIRSDASRLQDVLDLSREASSWFDDRPPVLDCLLALTEAFPTGSKVWVTQWHVDDEMVGTLKCKATNKDAMLAYLASMRQSASLINVELRDWQETGRDQRVVVFEITFRYQPGAKEVG